jgi:hypothetical protein
MRPQSSTIARAARIARAQHGLVTRAQLLGAGVGARAIGRWLQKGLLHAEHPGVYRLGHRAPSVEAKYMAAVLAGGEGCALSGFAAAHNLGALRRPPAPEITGPVDLRLRGVITRRLAPLADEDVRTVERIATTSPARTVVDLAARADLDTLTEISHVLGVMHGLEAADVFAAMARRGRVNGAAKLRAIYEGDAAVLLSKLERAFVRLIRDAGLPLPQTNRRHGSFYVDCRWPGLTVELLGYRFHASRAAWTKDQRRAREAYARGDDFRAYTWDDLNMTPGVVLAELTPVLRAARRA